MLTAGNLLVESLKDKRLVLSWCHRSVALVSSRRYRREIDDIKGAHHDISSLFRVTSSSQVCTRWTRPTNQPTVTLSVIQLISWISSLFLETWLNGKLPPPPPPTATRCLVPASPSIIGPPPATGDQSPPAFVVVIERTASIAISPLAADRHIAAQPLLLSAAAYNLRRVAQLWYQLLNAGQFLITNYPDFQSYTAFYIVFVQFCFFA